MAPKFRKLAADRGIPPYLGVSILADHVQGSPLVSELGSSTGRCGADVPRNDMSDPREALYRTFEWPLLRRSLIVAIVVGSALNAINQGPELLSGHPLVLWKLVLTYFVPFAVASYGSYAAFRSS